jgi:tetratricopeptide (TPR) repeat protein
MQPSLVRSHKMNNLLKAMGFWIWGLIAIGLSVSMVSVSYKVLSLYRGHDLSADRSDDTVHSTPETSAASASATGAKAALAPSSVIVREMTSAQNAMQSARWTDALTQLEAAKSRSPLTAFDEKTIHDWMGVVYLNQKNTRAAQSAYEAALATGRYSAEELVKIFRLLFQLAATNKQDAKAIEYGKQAAEAGAATDADLLIMSQLYYQQKDCKNSAAWGDKSIASFKKAGQPPKEVLYQLKLQCASDANDTNGMRAALYDLILLTNKTSYWNNLIRLERQDERDDHNTLMIYRVMFDTNSMNADTDYIEMAQLLGDARLPGEAQVVLEKAMSSGVLKDEHRERTTRLLSALKTRADADMEGLPALDAAASKNAAGQLDVKVGEIYFGAGDYRNAASAISRGISKGQVGQLDEAYVSLGRSLTREKDTVGAKQTLARLQSLPNINPRVLKLWNLYADTLPETASEPR